MHSLGLERANCCGFDRLANRCAVEGSYNEGQGVGFSGDDQVAHGPPYRQENLRYCGLHAHKVLQTREPWPPQIRQGGSARGRLRKKTGLCTLAFPRSKTAGKLVFFAATEFLDRNHGIMPTKSSRNCARARFGCAKNHPGIRHFAIPVPRAVHSINHRRFALQIGDTHENHVLDR